MKLSLEKIGLVILITLSLSQVGFSQVVRNLLSPEEFYGISINNVSLEQMSSANGDANLLQQLLGTSITIAYEVNDINNSVIVTWGSVKITFVNEDDNPSKLDYLSNSRYWIGKVRVSQNSSNQPYIKMGDNSFYLSDSSSKLSDFNLSQNGSKFYLFSMPEIPTISISVKLDKSGSFINELNYNEF